jgi:hypothetical protein
MKKILFVCISLFLVLGIITSPSAKELEIQGKRLVSQKPPFTLVTPSDLRFVHSFSHENPGESSLTRVYFFVKSEGKQLEEMLIVQISDKTDPQGAPMTLPPLKPYTEKRLYVKEKMKKADLEGEYLIQLMAWNPEAPSLQPIVKKGILIPSYWALQGQFQFKYMGEHAVSFRYSKDVRTFGMKVSDEGRQWEKELLSGNERKVYEIFRKAFTEMIRSIEIKNP